MSHSTILLVDDDPLDRRLMSSALAKQNLPVEIKVARDGVDALEQLETGDLPDFIIFDLSMPRMDGHTLLNHIRADNRLKRIPMVTMSTSDSETDINRAYEAGANAYLTKPSSSKDYASIAESIIQFWFNTAKRPKLS